MYKKRIPRAATTSDPLFNAIAGPADRTKRAPEIHDFEGAPIMAGMVASKFAEMGTGGWAWIFSEVKSALEIEARWNLARTRTSLIDVYSVQTTWNNQPGSVRTWQSS
jgi:hypothetical protein